MKNRPMATVLLAALVVSAIASLILCWFFIGNTGEMRRLQGSINQINYARTMVNSLVHDSMEYSGRNPQMERVLESLGITNTPPAKPAGK